MALFLLSVLFRVFGFYSGRLSQAVTHTGNLEWLGLEGTGEETPHRVRRLLLHGGGDVGVGIQGKPGAVVTQHGGEGFHAYSVLQGQHRECVTEVVEANVRETSPLQQNFQLAVCRARIGGLFRLQRVGEYLFSECGLFPLTENLYRTGRQHDLPSAGAGLGIPGSQSAASFPVNCAADFQRTSDFIEVLPLESADLTPPQTGGQLGVEEVMPNFILRDDFHERIQLLVRQYLLCPIAEPGSGSGCWQSGEPAAPPSTRRGVWCGGGALYRWPGCHSAFRRAAAHLSA